MAADPIVYCLQQLTDYRQFERFSNDLMLLEGYPELEPIGGTGDKGRDAINVSRSNLQDVTIFAYSVREDWHKKLNEDAAKIVHHGHKCNRLVFSCNAELTGNERDNAIKEIQNKYGMQLEIFGLERIRSLVAVKHQKLIGQHPSIFTPDFFPRAGGLVLSNCRDYILVDHCDADHALANWLAQRLVIAGYQVWCRTTAPVAGSSLNDTIESLIRNRVCRLVSILSASAMEQPDLVSRRTQALTIKSDILIPAMNGEFDQNQLDARTRALESISFTESWARGLSKLLQVLQDSACPKFHDGLTALSARSLFPTDVISDDSERLLSNRFSVLQIPKAIYRFDSAEPIEAEALNKLSQQWAFRVVSPTRMLSFEDPPKDLKAAYRISDKGGVACDMSANVENIPFRILIPELIKKSLLAHCLKSGLLYCEDSRLTYFPENLVQSERLYFLKPDQSKTFVVATGERTYWRPGVSIPYKYHLAPTFFINSKSNGHYSIVCRIRVRLTDANGVLLPPRTRLSRRKHLCKNWWNDDWLHRVLAVMNFLSKDGTIRIGETENRTVVLNAIPDQWDVSPSIIEGSPQDAEDMREQILVSIIRDDAEATELIEQ